MHRLHYKHIPVKITLILWALLISPTWTFAREISLEEKVGQLFILGFPDSDFEQTISPQLKKIKAGGIIWFRRNLHTIDQIQELNTKVLKATGTVAPLIMLDQEGGVVSRLHMLGPFPSALSLGRLSSLAEIQAYGRELGRCLAGLGFNANLSPVLDVSNPSEVNFLGTRVFSGDPRQVSAAALALARGLGAGGVLPIAKHFPGHGGITGDSHRRLPQKMATLDQLRNLDLIPFADFSRAFPVSGVMTAHVAFPNIDTTQVAASFSAPILQILRDQLSYRGLILTDDLEMSGARGAGTVGDRAVAALKAGSDMVMITWNQSLQQQAFEAVLAAVRSGEITTAQIEDRYQRILNVKKQIQQDTDGFELSEAIVTLEKHILRMGQYHFQKAVRAAAATIQKNHPRKILVASADRAFNQNFSNQLTSNFYELTKLTLNRHHPEPFEADDADCVVFYVTGEGSARLLRSLSPDVKRRTLVVNSAYPAVLGDSRQYYGVVDVLFSHPQAGTWMAKVFQKAATSALKVSSF